MSIDFVVMFACMSFLSSLWSRNVATGTIKECQSYSPLNPKGYIVPPKWIRTVFKLSKRKIPRYLCFELIMTLVFAALCPINTMITAIVTIVGGDTLLTVGILSMFHACLIIANAIFFIIMSSIRK